MLQDAVLALLLTACSTPAGSAPALPVRPPVEEPAPEPAPPPVPEASRYAATQILVAWAGAAGAPPRVTRSEAEAEQLARELHARAASGAAIEELARAFSDGREGPRGGSLGSWIPGTFVPEFERAVAAVPPGELAEPFRTPFGWHVARRDPVEDVHLAHVLVSWQGAWRSQAARTKDEARARAEEALRRIEGGEDVAEVARALSDDPTATRGGDLGLVGRGQLVPAVEEAGFALSPGDHSGIVESPLGFHVVVRLAQ